MALRNAQPLRNKPVPYGPSATAAGWRFMLEQAGMQEGVWGAGDLDVTQRGAGANKSVDVAAGTGWVKGEDTAYQGLYQVLNDAVVNLTVTDNTSGSPRIDQVILRVFDSTVTGASDTPTLSVLAGTPSSGAQASNATGSNYRAGAASLPNGAIRLADIEVANGFASITNANIIDRRPWARGIFNRIIRTAGTYSGGLDYGMPETANLTELDVANITRRYECSGNPIRVAISGTLYETGAASVAGAKFAPFLDGVNALGAAANDGIDVSFTTANVGLAVMMQWILVPSAGMHTIGIGTVATILASTDLVLKANGNVPFIVTVEELVRQIASNT